MKTFLEIIPVLLIIHLHTDIGWVEYKDDSIVDTLWIDHQSPAVDRLRHRAQFGSHILRFVFFLLSIRPKLLAS